MAYRRGKVYWAWIRLRNDRRRRVSLGTRDRRVAREIERTLRMLADHREWELLEAAADGTLSPGEVYDHERRNDLSALRARLNDADLADHVDPWLAWLKGRVSSATAKKYLRQLRHLIPEEKPCLRSEMSRAKVTRALHELERRLSGSTVRQYHAAWSSFFRYLVDIEVLRENPVRRVRLPRPNPPRERWLPLDLSMRLVEAQPPPYRALAALREGAGVEISAALSTRRRDVDRDRHIVHVHGTKNMWRDRLVRVDDWAWPHLEEHIRNLLPDALLWGGITYDAALHAHRWACKALNIPDYQQHDARHSYAVRHMKAGDDVFLIANQLGHRDPSMVLKIYGKYRPQPEDFRRISAARGGNS